MWKTSKYRINTSVNGRFGHERQDLAKNQGEIIKIPHKYKYGKRFRHVVS